MTSITDVNFLYIILSFFAGVIITILTITTRSRIIRALAYVMGIIPIFAVLFEVFPSPTFNITIEQTVDRMANLGNIFVNIVIPYGLGVSLSSIGYQIIYGSGKIFK